MKVKKYTVTSTDLNAEDYIEIDLSYTDTKDTHLYLPKALKFINSTSATIGFLYLATDTEKTEASKIPDWYEYLELPSGASTVDIPKTLYLRVSKTAGTASGNLTIYGINYATWQGM